VTEARQFIAWAQNNTTYTDSPEETIWEYVVHNDIGDVEEVDRRETGDERRWDRETETVWRFPDDSIAISRHWEPLQYDHADGVEPDASWFPGEPFVYTSIRYRVIV
jgi:hypothetical protein